MAKVDINITVEGDDAIKLLSNLFGNNGGRKVLKPVAPPMKKEQTPVREEEKPVEKPPVKREVVNETASDSQWAALHAQGMTAKEASEIRKMTIASAYYWARTRGVNWAKKAPKASSKKKNVKGGRSGQRDRTSSARWTKSQDRWLVKRYKTLVLPRGFTNFQPDWEDHIVFNAKFGTSRSQKALVMRVMNMRKKGDKRFKKV